jgi:hypothetical protein
MQAQTIDEVIIQLEFIINESIKTNNRIGYFTSLYHKVTCHVRDGIKNNVFDDGKRMEQFDVLFANRFLNAWEQYDKGDKTSQSWLIVFDSTKKKSLLVLQHLLLGINTHINLDLGIAVVETMNGKNLKDIQNDFNKINVILAALSYELIRDIDQVSPLMSLMGLHAENKSSVLIQFTIENARNGAWNFAEELFDKTGTDYNSCIISRDISIKNLANGIMHFSGIINFTLWLIHLFEWKNVGKIIKTIYTLKKQYFKNSPS